ncbi:MAG: hypothetical protein AB7O45_07495 [Alphaproteobacteria bacterium]
MTAHEVGGAFAGAGFVAGRPVTLGAAAVARGPLYTLEMWPKRLADALDDSWSFLAGVPSGWTFARASAATYWAPAGSPAALTLQTASSGVARVDYDPLTGAVRGLLMEGQRTNLLLRSAAFDDAAWTKIGGMTVTANAIAAPDGATAADLVVAGGSTFGGVIRQSITKAQGTTYTWSVFAKMSTHRYLGFRLPDNVAASADGNTYTTFDLVDGAVVASPDPYVTTAAEALPGGWWRLSVTGTTPAGAVNDFCDLALTENANGNINYAPAGSPTLAVYLWGAQVEAGGHASTYIATGAAGATRVADTLALDDVAAWSGAEGAAMVEALLDFLPAGFTGLFSFDDGTSANKVDLTYDGTQLLPAVAKGGTDYNIGLNAATAGETFRAAFAWTVGSLAASRDGSPGSERITMLAAPAPNRVVLGRLFDDSGAMFGTVRRLYAVNRYLSARALTFLSANGRPPPRVAAIDAGDGTARVLLADRAYVTADDDSPARIPADPVFGDGGIGLALTRSLLTGDDVGGVAAVEVSDIVAVNAAGAFDQLTRDHAPDGRRWRVKVGLPGRAHTAFATVAEGALERWSIDEERFVAVPRDASALLDVAVQTRRFTGSGGLEGGEDLADRPKPAALGPVRNVAAPLVQNTAGSPVTLTYLLNAGPPGKAGCIRNVAVYDDGQPFAAAYYSVDTDGGTVTLNTAPVGTVTFDFEGGVVEAGSPTTRTWPGSAAELLDIVLTDFLGIDAALIDPHSFALAAADAGGAAGLWLGTDEQLGRDVVAAIVAGFAGWLAPDRARVFRCGVTAPPGSVLTAPHRLTEAAEIVALEPIDPPANLFPPARRVRAGWRRNHTLQTAGLAGLVANNPERVEFLKTEYRITAVATDAADDHLLARDPPPVPTLVDHAEHAAIVRDARRQVVAPTGPGRLQRAFRAVCVGLPPELELMDDVAVYHSRFNLVGGACFRVVEISARTESNETELVLLR